jgi:hypothetical protein
MISRYFRSVRILWCIVAVVLPLAVQSPSQAAIGEDTEKPVPEFTRAGNTVTAKLIPRAKSTSVLIDFSTDQGKLTDVKGIEFDALKTPKMDDKEFKSSFFDVSVDVSPGAEADITISSSFFTISTEYWLYDAKKPEKWFNSGVKATKGSDDAIQFTIRVTDGGELDSDGTANGRIQLIGGPKDYFWSYALGTLVVRFFGIFLVLSMLMIGMLSVGQIFIAIDKRRARRAPPVYQPPKPAPAPRTEPDSCPEAPSTTDAGPDPDMVAAIATALYLHLDHRKSPAAMDAGKTGQNSWVAFGRAEIQSSRSQTFQRPVHPKKHA